MTIPTRRLIAERAHFVKCMTTLKQENKRLLGLIKKASDQLGEATAETPAPIAYAQGYLLEALAADKQEA